MALVKLIIGIGAVVLFMPTDKESQAKVFDATVHAVERVSTFCVRNPATCERGGEYWAIFKQKAEFGGRMVWTLAVDRMNAKRGAEPIADADERKLQAIPVKQRGVRTEIITGTTVDRGTLTPRDLEPAWRPAAPSRRNT